MIEKRRTKMYYEDDNIKMSEENKPYVVNSRLTSTEEKTSKLEDMYKK